MLNISSFINTATQGGGGDFSQLGDLFGNSSGGGGGGFNLSQLGGLVSGSSGGSSASSGGGLGNGIGSLAGGAIGTFLLPGIGTALGAGLGGALGGLFGNSGPKGTEAGNADIIAAAVGITRQQAMDLCAMVEDEAGDGGPNFDDIVQDYASHPQEILGLIPRYNRKNPGKAIYPQTSAATSQGSNTQAEALAQIQAIIQAKSDEEAKAKEATEKAKTSKTTTYALLGGGALLAIIIAILLLKK